MLLSAHCSRKQIVDERHSQKRNRHRQEDCHPAQTRHGALMELDPIARLINQVKALARAPQQRS